MTSYRGTYGDAVTGGFALPDLAGSFLMTTLVDMTFDEVRRVAGDLVSAVVSGSGTVTFQAFVGDDSTTRTDTLTIAPTPIVFSLTDADPLMPEFGPEYGYFGSNDLFFRGAHSFFRDGVELNAGTTALESSGSGDFRWSDGTLSLSGTWRSSADLRMRSPLLWVRDDNTLTTEAGAAHGGITFEITREDAALDAVTVDWWVTGDTGYDYTQRDSFGPRAPVLLDDFVGATIPAGTVSFAAGQKTAYVTVTLADDGVAEPIERLQLNVTPDSSGLFNIRFAGTASVTDDDPLPGLSIAPVEPAADEGTGGGGAVVFEVLRSGNMAGPATAIWGAEPVGDPTLRSADALDFAGGAYPSGVLVLADGQARATVTVALAGDALAERDETFAVRLVQSLADPADINVGQRLTSAVIRNDDTVIGDLVVHGTDGLARAAAPALYAGPVPGIDKECILLDAEDLVVATQGPNWFIHTAAGNDAVALTGGRNVVDGGTGSNFIAAASGADTVFLDIRGAAAPVWSTMTRFGLGDMATVWGLVASGPTVSWVDGLGAPGFTGLTLVASVPGQPVACLTLGGVTRVDLDSGRLAVGSAYDWGSASYYTGIWLRW